MRCFACNVDVPVASGERIGFRDDCERCGADLHVCKNCTHHDPSAYNECRESNAERVADRDRANRCDYFSPADAAGIAPDAAGGPGEARSAALSDLDALFKK
jgi:hypothetical protein